MVDFDYQGVDRAGKRVSGTLSSQSEGEVRVMLRAMGVRPTRIARKSESTAVTLSKVFRREPKEIRWLALSLKEKIVFTRQLQVMISSGIPLVQGLDILSEQSENLLINRMVVELRDKVSEGAFFWETLAAYPYTFSRIYIALVRAGESSGSLDIVLKRLTRYLEDADRLRRMIVQAMIYPVIVITIGVGVVAGLLIFVVPKLADMLSQNKVDLPLPTKIVMGASEFLTQNFFLIFGTLGFGAFFLARFIKTTEGKAALDRILYQVPLFGSLVQKGAIAAFSRTMQTLLNAGVNLVDAVDIAKSTVDNSVVADAISKIRVEVEQGKSLASVVAGIPVFPRMATQMISVGESTGNMDKMLEKVADFYEAEVESVVGSLGKAIEPLIIVFLGGAVAIILLAMYLPVFKIAGSGEMQ